MASPRACRKLPAWSSSQAASFATSSASESTIRSGATATMTCSSNACHCGQTWGLSHGQSFGTPTRSSRINTAGQLLVSVPVRARSRAPGTRCSWMLCGVTAAIPRRCKMRVQRASASGSPATVRSRSGNTSAWSLIRLSGTGSGAHHAIRVRRPRAAASSTANRSNATDHDAVTDCG